MNVPIAKDYVDQFIRSSISSDNQFQSLDDVRRWIRELQSDSKYRVEPIKFKELDGWYIEDETSNIRHQSGRYFSVEGLSCQWMDGSKPNWIQPIIKQPEVGILGIMTKMFNGTRYFLMQAKMEPGNVNLVQLSPTLQATYSNYTQVHKGNLPPYLEFFLNDDVIAIHDQLQSETGTRFFRKFNRNILIDVTEDVPLRPEFRWLTLCEIQELIAEDDLINMDSRSVLSNIDFGVALEDEDSDVDSTFLVSARSKVKGVHTSSEELEKWLEDQTKKCTLQTELVPLANAEDWELDEWGVHNPNQNFFSVVAVAVEAGEREVPKWTQPLLRHEGLGIAGFLSKSINGILHFLVQAKAEPGIVDYVELGPTVSMFDLEGRLESQQNLPFLNYFIDPSRNHQKTYTTIQSEEGGRFWNLRNEFVVMELPEDEDLSIPDSHHWMTLGQLYEFSQGESKVNSDARTLLACLPFKNR